MCGTKPPFPGWSGWLPATQGVALGWLGAGRWPSRIAPAGESTVVFRDSAFADDVAKTNLTAILQQHGLETPAVNKHLKNIYATGELTPEATISKMETVQAEGARYLHGGEKS